MRSVPGGEKFCGVASSLNLPHSRMMWNRGHLSHWPKGRSVAALLPRFKGIDTDTKGTSLPMEVPDGCSFYDVVFEISDSTSGANREQPKFGNFAGSKKPKFI